MKRLLILIGLMVMVATAFGVTEDRPYYLPAMPGLDSVRILIFQDTVTAATDSVSAELNSFPETGNISLDTRYWYEIRYYAYWYGLTDTIYQTSEIVNFNAPTRLPSPDSALGAHLVTVYIDVAKSFADGSGDIIPRSKLELTLQLIGYRTFEMNDIAILPTDSTQTPDSTGRCTWEVPATTVLTPSWGKYRLTYKARDRGQNIAGTIRQFIVDTLPDPINIMETTEAF